MCANDPGAEGAWFGAGGFNPLEFVSSECVFPPIRVSHWDQHLQHQKDTGGENASRLHCWGLDELNLCFQDQGTFP